MKSRLFSYFCAFLGRRGYRSKSGGARNEKNEKLLVEVAVEAEFKTFMEGLKKKFGGNQLAYRVSNYPEVNLIFY